MLLKHKNASCSRVLFYLLLNGLAGQRKKRLKVRAKRLMDKLWLQVQVSEQDSDLTEREELLIVALSYINH